MIHHHRKMASPTVRSTQETPSRPNKTFPPYGQLKLDIIETVTTEDVEKFAVLSNLKPATKSDILSKSQPGIALLDELEKQDLIRPDKVNYLIEGFRRISHKKLAKRVEKYQENYASRTFNETQQHDHHIAADVDKDELHVKQSRTGWLHRGAPSITSNGQFQCSKQHSAMDDWNQNLIENYFNTGYTYQEIIQIMASDHNLSISLRKLKRILHARGLFRRKHFSREEDVAAAISEELETSGSLLGYRLMYQRLRCKYGIKTTYTTVRQILKILDPEGVHLRSARRLRRRQYYVRGPNDVWHIDGNDKLLPYGFAIHGAIDGYSGKVLWLEVGRSNKNPEVTAAYYLKYVRELGGTALTLRFDPGTENGLTADLQHVLSLGDCRVLYGKSTANQRIESWWSFLKRMCLTWWINLFKDLIFMGVYNNSEHIEVEAVRYFFGDLLRDELQSVALQWNLHPIRQVRDSVSPAGRPEILYHSPQLTGSDDFKYLVETEDLDIVEDDLQINVHPQLLCSPEAKEIIEIIMDGPKNPLNVFQAIDMFQLFLTRLQQF